MHRFVVAGTVAIVVAMITFPLPAEEPAPVPEPEIAGQALPVVVPTPWPGPPALRWALARAVDQPAAGAKALPTPPAGSWGIVSEGSGGGGIFRDTDSEAEAWLGASEWGIQGYGSSGGGYFENSVFSGVAYLGILDYGILGYGSEGGGYFGNSDGSGFAYAAHDRPSGNDKGGDVNAGEYGVYAGGSMAGGYFEDSDSTGYAYVGRSDFGIRGYGAVSGGYFSDYTSSGYAYVGYSDYGIYARGSSTGGFFEDNDSTGFAYVGYGDYGIWGNGSSTGGYFRDTDNSTYAYVAHSAYKIYGTGTVSFVQNHPLDPSSVIVYAAPEGDEVATYTRGTARLDGGEAKVSLGETFQWVTNPDIGLTAFLTPVNDWCDLYVAEQGTDSIVVRSRDGSDCTFNFMVYGLRIGFEESTIVQEKQRQSYIPSMADHRELAARRPELAGHTALARWAGQAKALGNGEALDLSRAHALRDLIGEYHPALHGPVGEPLGLHNGNAADRVEMEVARVAPVPPEAARARGAVPEPLEDSEEGQPTVAALPSRDVYARSFRPSAGDLASLLEVSEAVGPGDVLVIDPERPDRLRRGVSAADPTVVGVVVAEPGVVLGSGAESEGARAAVTFSGIAACKVDATFGPVYPGDLLVTSPNPGHAMRADQASPGTVLGKALEELTHGAATIRILVMPR